MVNIFLKILDLIINPEFAVIIICLVALAVAGMAVYGMTLAIKKRDK